MHLLKKKDYDVLVQILRYEKNLIDNFKSFNEAID